MGTDPGSPGSAHHKCGMIMSATSAMSAMDSAPTHGGAERRRRSFGSGLPPA